MTALPEDEMQAYRDALDNAQAAYERAGRAIAGAERERNEAAKVIRQVLDDLERALLPRGRAS